MTLYLKYRPKNLDELDLVQVAESLKKIVASKSIPHALLFSGPKGTGKTSAARILAKIINCEHLGQDNSPCNECEQCLSIVKGSNLDVIEMDAASHRGIDDVRTLRDAVKLAPTKAGKKIYIVDEAHMLTTEASNALLKTLEEPPEHVVFILATTNPEKLIDTILSRTTPVNFRKATTPEIVRSLKRVVDGEKIKIDEASLIKIAEASNGAFRDAIKMLEQFSLEGETFLIALNSLDPSSLIKHLALKAEKEAIEEIENSVKKGVSVGALTKSLLSSLHSALIAEAGIGDAKIEGLNKNDLIKLIGLIEDAYALASESPIEQLPLQIAIFKWCNSKSHNQRVADKNILKEKERTLGDRQEVAQKESVPEIAKIIEVEVKSPDSDLQDNIKYETFEGGSPLEDNIWQNILKTVRPINASIEGLLRSSKPINFDGKTLTLGVFYKFHKERLEDVKHRKILEEVMAKTLNTPARVVCTLMEQPPQKIIEMAQKSPVLTENVQPDIIKAAEEIFSS
jgi:DNA polymerase-3 subunit gamma/tau